MKKSIVALAILGSIAGAASAQSSVTLFGVIDLATRYTKSNGESKFTLSKDGMSSSRIGVRGVEDLGGGLKAGFWLESGVSADTGAGGSSSAGFWHRRSTVSLMGDFGEVRLGRDKTASQLFLDDIDPYSNVGQGAAYNTYSLMGAAGTQLFGDSTQNRNNNQVMYFTPTNLGGFYGQLNVAAGEGVGSAGSLSQKQVSARAGYKAGALNVGGALNQTTIDGNPNKVKLAAIGGSYDLGVVKPALLYTQVKFGARKQDNWTIAATAPVGPGVVMASYTNSKFNDTARLAGYGDKAEHFTVGYLYNLSKRTALYGNVSEIKNKGASTFVLTDAYRRTAFNNGDSGSVDVGIKHAF